MIGVKWWITRPTGYPLEVGCRLVSALRLELFFGTYYPFLARPCCKLSPATYHCSLSTAVIVESLFHQDCFLWMSLHPDKIINRHLIHLLSYQNCHIFASNVCRLYERYCRQIYTNLGHLIYKRNNGRHMHRRSELILHITCMCFMGITF